MHPHPAPPQLRLSLSEGMRALLECNQLLLASPLLARAPRGDGHPVMTLPGFGGADGSMAPLRYWLQRWGYDAKPWELGRNFPKYRLATLDDAQLFREKMVLRCARRIETLYRETGRKVSLVGWSLGGIYANELAQSHGHWIRQVITLGTPHGDPRGTAAWNIMRRFYRSEVPEEAQNIEGWIAAATTGQHTVPTTVIYSRHDGIVSTAIARLPSNRFVENIEVKSSHMGFAMNPRVYWLLAKRLAGQSVA